MNIFALLFLIFVVSKIIEAGKKKSTQVASEKGKTLDEGKNLGEGMPLGEGTPFEMPAPVRTFEMKPFVSAQPAAEKKPAVQNIPLPVQERKDMQPPLARTAQEKSDQPEQKEFVHSFSSRPQTIAMAAENLAKRQERTFSAQEKERDEKAEQRRQDLVRGVIVSEILNRPNRFGRFQRR